MSVLFKHNVNWQYALGEIVLIFVGITLAMGFDNWNDERQIRIENEQLRIKYINDLHVDITQTDQFLQENLQTLRDQYDAAYEVVVKIESGHVSNEDLVDLSVITPITWGVLNPKRYPQTFDALIGLGNQEILDNDSLLTMLTKFYFDYDEMLLHFSDLPQEFRSEWRKYNIKISNLAGNTDPPSTPQRINEIKEIVQSDEAYQLLLGLVATSNNFLVYFENIRQDALSIKSYLEDNYEVVLKPQ